MNFKHGESKTVLYKHWDSMKSRTFHHVNYIKNNITFCDEWSDFLVFKEWALLNGYSDGLSLDRVDNQEGYSPSNCRWVTPKEQRQNTTKRVYLEFNGVTKLLTEWAKEFGIKRQTLYNRVIISNWSVERALLSNKGKMEEIE